MNIGPETEHMEHEETTRELDVACPDTSVKADSARLARKPFLPPEALVESLKSRGVTFELCGEAEAAAYLRDRNNYLRLASCRVMFDRKPPTVEGGGPGPYVNLDFGQLRDLSQIDCI